MMYPISLIENVSLPFLPSTFRGQPGVPLRSFGDPPHLNESISSLHILFIYYVVGVVAPEAQCPLPRVDHRFKEGVKVSDTVPRWGSMGCLEAQMGRGFQEKITPKLHSLQTDRLGIKNGKRTSGQENSMHGGGNGYIKVCGRNLGFKVKVKIKPGVGNKNSPNECG